MNHLLTSTEIKRFLSGQAAALDGDREIYQRGALRKVIIVLPTDHGNHTINIFNKDSKQTVTFGDMPLSLPDGSTTTVGTLHQHSGRMVRSGLLQDSPVKCYGALVNSTNQLVNVGSYVAFIAGDCDGEVSIFCHL